MLYIDVTINSLNITNPMMLKAWGMGFKRPPQTMESVKVAGRLAYLVDTWKVLTKDNWVLNTVQGYQIPLTGKPLQHQRPSESVFSKEQAALLREEIVSLLQKGAISPISTEPGGFFSTIFLVPKKNRPNEASDQLEVPQPVGGGPTLQNGGHCDLERSSEAGGIGW